MRIELNTLKLSDIMYVYLYPCFWR